MINSYKRLNQSFNKRLIFNFGYEAGLYSELNNMILAVVYCLEHEIEFVIYSKDAKFARTNAWNDFFIPFCRESQSAFHKYFNRRDHNLSTNPVFRTMIKRFFIVVYKLLYPNTYLTGDLWRHFHNVDMEERRYTFPNLGIVDLDLRDTCARIIDIICVHNAKTKSQIIDLKCSVNLPSEYIGVHIRRGDKITESMEVSTDIYIQKILDLNIQCKNVFVLTDDYTVIEDLENRYTEWNFYTLTKHSERGYNYAEYNKKKVEDKISDIIKLFAAVEILRSSEVFIGTYSSNPGMFLGMCKDRTKVYGVDLEEWKIW
jgi:hypothetical protein